MALPSGLAGSVGYKAESTYGTAVTVDRFVPLVSESLVPERKRLVAAGIRAGRRTLDSDQWRAGEKLISGGIQHELTDNTIGLLLKSIFGANVTSGVGPYTHTMTPGDPIFYTTQIGKPGVDGTVRPFTFSGCMTTGAQIAAQRGGIATLGLDVVAQDWTTATALASPSYGSSDSLLAFVDTTITLGGSTMGVVSGFSLNIENGLKTDRYDAGSTKISKPLEEGRRKYSGVVTAEFVDLTQWNRHENSTEAELIIALVSGANSLTFTMNVRLDKPSGPAVSGTDVVEVGWAFEAIGDGTDADACTCVLVNNDSTA